MADPLVLLQEYAMGKRELRKVKHNDKLYYVFGDIAYPHDAKTNLGVYNKQNEYYTIESILLFWKMRELQHTAYVRDVSGRGIASITRVQRRDLLDFLLGGQLPKEANMMAPIPPSILATHLQPEDESQQQQQHEPQKKKPKLDQRQQDEKGQRIDKILDKSIGGGDKDDVASAEVVRGLSSALPAEKVAQLRNRVKSNLKNKPSHVAITSSETSTMTGVAAGKDGISHYIQEKERIRKDRTTCLESPSRDFSSILALLKDIHMRENQAKSIHHDHLGSAQPGVASAIPSVGSASQASVKSGQKPPMPGGYSRYDQEIFQRDTMADFVIDTDLSFHGNNTLNQMKNQQAAHLSTSSSSFPLPPPLILPQQSSSVSNGVHSSTGRTDQRQNAGSSMNSGAGQQRSSKRVSRTPIIVIPATGTALITMYNAQDILQDLRFVSSEEKKRFYRRENELLLQINKNGAAVPYRVIDNPTKLKDEEWDRVVAVFVQGPAWQFKGWKWNGNPVEIFANVAAFHLKFEEQKLDPNVAKWSVNVLSLSRTKRHLDRAILQKFWEILDRHISKSSKREWLRY